MDYVIVTRNSNIKKEEEEEEEISYNYFQIRRYEYYYPIYCFLNIACIERDCAI